MSLPPTVTTPTTATRPGSRRGAWALVLLAPVLAEIAFGSTPLEYAYLVLLWMPIYGAGVLLIREAVRRTGRGWPSIALLGLAYELMEDGPGLQALSSPHLYDAAHWGVRLLGLNVTYWEANAIYHMIFSVAIPILLTDRLFPAHRREPYLGCFGLVVTGVVALLGVGILRVAVPPSLDPGYVAPLPVLIGCLVAVVLLVAVALRVIPPRGASTRDGPEAVPSRAGLAVGGALSALILLGLLFPFGGARQPAFTQGWWVLVPMGLAAAVVAGGGWQLRRWSRRHAWTDGHMLALATGALVGHSIAGAVNAGTPLDRVGLVVIAALTAALLLPLSYRRTREPVPRSSRRCHRAA